MHELMIVDYPMTSQVDVEPDLESQETDLPWMRWMDAGERSDDVTTPASPVSPEPAWLGSIPFSRGGTEPHSLPSHTQDSRSHDSWSRDDVWSRGQSVENEAPAFKLNIVFIKPTTTDKKSKSKSKKNDLFRQKHGKKKLESRRLKHLRTHQKNRTGSASTSCQCGLTLCTYRRRRSLEDLMETDHEEEI